MANLIEKDGLEALFDTANGFPAALSNSWKIWGHRNALFTQHFGADPTTIVYEDRVYLFTSNDTFLYDADGEIIENKYTAGIQGIHVSSSADLANWTDHGVLNIAGPESTNPLIDFGKPLVNYANASWAPSAAWKMIDGKPRFFLFWCNGGDGIGVITADHPLGPWRSPRDTLLIDRNTPNCSNVVWLFDPGVLADDDGSAYLFCGGGTEGTPADNTGQARRVRLSDDMASIIGTPETFYVPYLFESMDMFAYNGKYHLTYCANWGTDGNKFGLHNCEIAYISADDPMGQFGEPKGILRTAATQLDSGDTNNHQHMFVFKDTVYIAYHTQKPAQAMGLPNSRNYRSASIDKVTINADGTIAPITMTRKGVDQVGYLNPYAPNAAATIAVQGGIYTRPEAGASKGMVVTSIDTGDWLAVYGVDFGAVGAKKFSARVRTPETPGDYIGAIELRLDPIADGEIADNGNLSAANTTRIRGGQVIGRVLIKAAPGENGKYATVTIDLDKPVAGVHDLVFVFYSSLGVKLETVMPDTRHKSGFEFDSWQFFA